MLKYHLNMESTSIYFLLAMSDIDPYQIRIFNVHMDKTGHNGVLSIWIWTKCYVGDVSGDC